MVFNSGKKYHGKGKLERLKRPLQEQLDDHPHDPLVSLEWNASTDEHQSYKDENTRLRRDRGHGNKNN